MNKIDLFGGTGFIGSTFNSMYSDLVYVHPRNDVIPVSDNVLYMISTTDNYSVFSDLYIDIDTNLKHLMNVLGYYKNHHNITKNVVFNFISSWFTYGKIDDLPAKETSVCNPIGFYSITKKCAEDLLISFCLTYKIKYRILRLCNVYGKGDGGVSKKKNALQYLINKIKNNENVGLYHDGNFIRDYMYVTDVCRAIKLCMDFGEVNSIINIGSGIPQNFREIIDFAIQSSDSKSKVSGIEPPEFHKIVQVKDMWLDISKLNGLNFKPEIDIKLGISKLLE